MLSNDKVDVNLDKVPDITADGALSNVQGWALAVISLILILVTIHLLWNKNQRDDYKHSANVAGTTIISMIPAVLGVAGMTVVLGYGAAVLNFVLSAFA